MGFTEHGAIMAATVLNSQQAIQMSVTVVTAFVKLRRMALSVESLARKVASLETSMTTVSAPSSRPSVTSWNLRARLGNVSGSSRERTGTGCLSP